MATFKMPTKIFYGPDSLDELSHLNMKKVLIICDPFMAESHKVDVITDILQQQNCSYKVFSEVVPDPTVEVVTKAISMAADLAPDAMIALGGGSAIDTAKAVRHIYQMAEKSKVCLVCVPTTSGTGSEVTSFAVISDHVHSAKYALVDDAMIPDIALLDAQFTMSVPQKVTADTGMDVLAHTLEAYVSTDASMFSDACAEKAMKVIWNDLTIVYRNGQDAKRRESVHNASCLAGMAFSEASLGICHSLAHALGGTFRIPHGRAITLLLPHVIAFNAGLDLANGAAGLIKYEAAARLLGVQAGTTQATVHSLIANIKRRADQLNMPKTVTDAGINETEFIAAIPEMAEKAMHDRCTKTNPRVPTQEDLENLYKRLCKGGI